MIQRLFILVLFSTFYVLANDFATYQDNPLFDMDEMMDESTLNQKVIKDWYTVEGKINALIEIIESLKISPDSCSKEHLRTLNKITKN